MSFRSIQLLWLLALVPPCALLLIARERHRHSVARKFVNERLRGVRTPWRAARPWLLALALAGLIVALAGPFAGFELLPVVTRDSSRVLLVDVSNSMAATDIGSSRLAGAKAIATRLSNAQQGRVALVVFEGVPEVVAPLTTDTNAVAELIDTIQTGETEEPGSDLGSALLAAFRLVESDPAQRADFVVISDGEDQGSRVSEAVQRARARGFTVSTILVGSGQGSTIPTDRGPLRDDSGDVVTTYARPEVLHQIAKSTGGIALENPFGARALDPLLKNEGAGRPQETRARVPISRFQWPLSAGILLLLAASFVNRGAE